MNNEMTIVRKMYDPISGKYINVKVSNPDYSSGKRNKWFERNLAQVKEYKRIASKIKKDKNRKSVWDLF